MNASVLRICLVTSSHISQNPRIVKEADALTEAGHAVRVVAMSYRRDHAAADAAVIRSRSWRLDTVSAGSVTARGRLRRLLGGIEQHVALVAARCGVRLMAVFDHAVSRHVRLLARVAAAEPADVVIGHTLAGLPAASRAARRLRARFGFDAEDFHAGELPDSTQYDAQRQLVDAVERFHLPQCHFVTAASDGIADALADAYAIRRPQVILNVFPRKSRPDRAVNSAAPRDEGLKLYWFSQVIGGDRGIRDVLAAMQLLDIPVHLYLRGFMSREYAREFYETVRANGLGERVHLLPPADADDLVRLAGEYDVGLALEVPSTRNRAICVTNKLFTYLLAGLAVAATDTPGQRRVMEIACGAGFIYPPGDAEALATGLRRLVRAPHALANAKAAAWDIATRRFCWDVEERALLQYITGTTIDANDRKLMHGVTARPGSVEIL